MIFSIMPYKIPAIGQMIQLRSQSLVIRFNLKVPEVGRTVHGTVYVNGRVRGRISGVVDAHIQGVIYGDVSGMLEAGSYQTKEVPNADETENQ